MATYWLVGREVVLDTWVGSIKSNKKTDGEPTFVLYQFLKNRKKTHLVHFILSGSLPA